MSADHMIFLFFGAVALTAMVIVVVHAKRSADNIMEVHVTNDEGVFEFIQIQQDELRRFANNLHNDTSTWITLTKSELNNALKKNNNPECEKAIKNALYNFSKLNESINLSLQESCPRSLSEKGLFYACSELCKAAKISEVAEITYTFKPDKINGKPEALHCAYRLFSELFNNLIKHSDARKLNISAEKTGNVVGFIIKHDGKKFNPFTETHKQGYGLNSLHARCKWLQASTRYTYENGENILEIEFDENYLTNV
jgi:signal transduction histidine kinase